jgi:hypothetical protein
MTQRCTACSCKMSPPASTSPLATPSQNTVVCAATAIEAFQLQSFFHDCRSEYTAPQAVQCPQSLKPFQSALMWYESPNPANNLSRSAQLPTNYYVSGDSELSHEEYCLDVSPSHHPGVIEICAPSSISVNKSKTNTNGDYQCYQHGCEGRRFSSSENYRRHVRERNKSDITTCPFCAVIFTRKSNQDTHVRKGRCKGLNGLLAEQINLLLDSEASLQETRCTTDIDQALVVGGAAARAI